MSQASPSHHFLSGVRVSIPIMAGYLPAALAFGLLGRTTGLTITQTTAMSLIVFAGASQFMALNLIASGAPGLEIILATVAVNLRHLLMSASIVPRVRGYPRRVLPFLAFGLTDEVYAVWSSQEGQHPPSRILGLMVASYGSWVGGSFLGHLAGQILPHLLQQAFGVVLYALFAVLLAGMVRNGPIFLWTAILAQAINTLAVRWLGLPSGWGMILAMTSSALICSTLFAWDAEKTPHRERG